MVRPLWDVLLGVFVIHILYSRFVNLIKIEVDLYLLLLSSNKLYLTVKYPD